MHRSHNPERIAAHAGSRARTPWRIVARTIVAAIVATLPTVASAQVRCGDVLRSGRQVTLQADLTCDDVETAIVVEGGAVLDLNGFALICEDANGNRDEVIVGVALEGRGAVLRGGTVRDCRVPVTLRGDGRHTVSDVTVLRASSVGMRVESDRNTIVDSAAFFSGIAGFAVQGRANFLARNVATGNRVGFDVAQRNRLEDNVAASSDLSGFDVRGRGAALIGNRAVGNLRGYSVSGIANRLDGNSADDNGTGVIFDDRAKRNVVQRGVVEDTTINGIVIDGEANRVLQNRVENSGKSGIVASTGATRIVVRGNVARRNGREDLFENAAGCGTNRWRNNEFATSNASCIE